MVPGTVLRQKQLADRFGVSRTPVREAIGRLAALGLVTFVPNRGIRIRPLSRQEMRDAFLVRAELEGLAAELATQRMTDEDLLALCEAQEHCRKQGVSLRMRATRQGEQDSGAIAWMQAYYAFHDVIYAASGLQYLERIAKRTRFTSVAANTLTASPRLDELLENNEQQLYAIAQAIKARCALGARHLAREHVLASLALFEAILDSVETKQGRRRPRQLQNPLTS